MKKLTLALLAFCMVATVTFTSCDKGGGDDDVVKTLKERVQGKTWGLGSVTKGATTVTSDFTGFKISFSADGASGTIITGGSSSETKNVTYNVGESTITISGTAPTNWAGTLTAVETDKPDGNSTFKFTVTITNPKTGAADHTFNLVKQ